VEHSPLFTQNSGERPEKKQEKGTDRAALVARGVGRGGAVVMVDGCGGRRWFFFFSPLLRCFFFLCFSFVLSTIFFPLYVGLGRCSW
jgi:hypothetical protein